MHGPKTIDCKPATHFNLPCRGLFTRRIQTQNRSNHYAKSNDHQITHPHRRPSPSKPPNLFFLQAFGSHPGFRLAHAKGIVLLCGTFEPSKNRAGLRSCAAHTSRPMSPTSSAFPTPPASGKSPDGDPNPNPKGIAIQFKLLNGCHHRHRRQRPERLRRRNPRGLREFLRQRPRHQNREPQANLPDQFLAAHPRPPAAFLGKPNPQPASFATYAYYGNNAFFFVNARGQRQATRYQIIPLAGEKHL